MFGFEGATVVVSFMVVDMFGRWWGGEEEEVSLRVGRKIKITRSYADHNIKEARKIEDGIRDFARFKGLGMLASYSKLHLSICLSVISFWFCRAREHVAVGEGTWMDTGCGLKQRRESFCSFRGRGPRRPPEGLCKVGAGGEEPH